MEVISFFLRPLYIEEREYNTKFRFKIIIRGLSFSIIGLLITSIIFGILHLSLGINLPQRSPISKHEFNSTYFLAIALLIAPAFEEVQDRLFLNLKQNSLFVSLVFIGIFFLTPLYRLNNWTLNHLLLLGLAIASAFALSRTLILKPKHFKYYFWFSVSMFSLGHIFNFQLNSLSDFALIPLWVMPQFFYGVALGYIRVNCGIIWSIVLHMIINTIAFLPEIIEYIK